jgi:hypothetical protein
MNKRVWRVEWCHKWCVLSSVVRLRGETILNYIGKYLDNPHKTKKPSISHLDVFRSCNNTPVRAFCRGQDGRRLRGLGSWIILQSAGRYLQQPPGWVCIIIIIIIPLGNVHKTDKNWKCYCFYFVIVFFLRHNVQRENKSGLRSLL